MKSIPIFAVALATATLFSSCLPRERMWWSPDGGRALVSTKAGLVLTDAEGKAVEVPAISGTLVTSLDGAVVWSPDGKSVVIALEKTHATWKEASARLPEGEVARVESLMKVLPHAVRAAREAMPVGGASLKLAFDGLAPGDQPLMVVALRAAFEADPDEVAGLFSNLEEEAEIRAALRGDDLAIKVHELRRQTIDAGRAVGESEVLATSLLPMGQLAISPDGTRLAFARGAGASRTLEHMASRGVSTPVVAGTYPGEYAATWSRDGRHLLVARLFNEGMPLGRLEAVPIAPADGKSEIRVLAEGMLTEPPALAGLPDGSVLFAASPVVYPLSGTEPRPHPEFHLVSPDGAKVEKLAVAGGSLPADLRFFEVSPDGRHIALVEAGSTTVATMEIATGTVKLAGRPSEGWKCRTRPAWRNAGEFTYAAEKDGVVVVMLHSLETGSRIWGGSQTEETFAEWLGKPDDK